MPARVSRTCGGFPRTRYDANNAQLSAISYDYDEFGRQVLTSDARNSTTTNALDALDRVVAVQTPAPDTIEPWQTTGYQYDRFGRVTAITNADQTVTFKEYYDTGELKKTWGARTYPVEYTYDYAGRMKTMTTWKDYPTSGAATTTWSYDNRGFMTNKVYADNKGPSYAYTPAGRLYQRAWARGVVTTYTTNAAGEVATITYSDGTPGVTNTFDRLGRKTQVDDGAGTHQFGYTDSGLVLTETNTSGWLAGLAVTNGYDALLRRNALGLSGQASMVVNYGYDAASRLNAVTNNDADTFVAQYSYLANSPLIEQVLFTQNQSNRLTTTKQYDLLNRLTNIVNTPSAGSPFSYRYGYNSANQRTNRVEADGSKWNYGYDDLGQVTSGEKYWADGTAVSGQQFEYTFDDIGNRETATANGRTQTYSANDLNQYTSRAVPGYLDVIGAATNSATVTVNATATSRKDDYYHGQVAVSNTNSSVWQPITNVAVIAVGTNDMVTNWTGHLFVPKTPEVFAYDADGNLTNDGRWAFTWDGENRLVAMQTHASAPAGSERRMQFGYDYQSRRVTKRVEYWTNSTWSVTTSNKFLYDRWNLVAELNGTNNSLVQGYVWGLDLSATEQGAGGVGGLLIIKGQLNGVHYAAYDGNGNVMGTVRAITGAVSAEYEYDPFGKTIRGTGLFADCNPIRFSTKYHDLQSGFAYYGYRYSDAGRGRWMNRDPLGEPGFEILRHGNNDMLGDGPNIYTFVKNAPVTSYDVHGLYIHIPLNIGSVLGDLWQRIVNGAKCLRAVTCGSCAGGLLGMEAICIGWKSQGYSSFNECVCVNYNESKLLQVMCRGCVSPLSLFGDPIKSALGCNQSSSSGE